MPKTNKRRDNRRKGGNQKWIKMLPANLFRSAHYLNLQPQQPLQLLCCFPSPPCNPAQRSPISFFWSYFLTIVPSPALHSLCLSPFPSHLNFPGLMFLQECPLPPLNTTGEWEGCWEGGIWEGLRVGVFSFFWEERRILGSCSPHLAQPRPTLFRLASPCDLWSLTSCLHMGGHGCGVGGRASFVKEGRIMERKFEGDMP